MYSKNDIVIVPYKKKFRFIKISNGFLDIINRKCSRRHHEDADYALCLTVALLRVQSRCSEHSRTSGRRPSSHSQRDSLEMSTNKELCLPWAYNEAAHTFGLFTEVENPSTHEAAFKLNFKSTMLRTDLPNSAQFGNFAQHLLEPASWGSW